MSKHLTSDWANESATANDVDAPLVRHMIAANDVSVPEDDKMEPSSEGRDKRINNHGLPSRNVVIDGKRTSIRLDAMSLESLMEIAERENTTVSELCSEINRRNQDKPFTFTAALRIFMLTYFRAAATEDGHRMAGHGQRSDDPSEMEPRTRAGRRRLAPRLMQSSTSTDARPASAPPAP